VSNLFSGSIPIRPVTIEPPTRKRRVSSFTHEPAICSTCPGIFLANKRLLRQRYLGISKVQGTLQPEQLVSFVKSEFFSSDKYEEPLLEMFKLLKDNETLRIIFIELCPEPFAERLCVSSMTNNFCSLASSKIWCLSSTIWWSKKRVQKCLTDTESTARSTWTMNSRWSSIGRNSISCLDPSLRSCTCFLSFSVRKEI